MRGQIDPARDEYVRLTHWTKWGMVGACVRSEHYEPDRDIFKSVIVENEYFAEDIPEPEAILDVGAHVGFFSVLMRHRFPNARIIAVEADRANLPALSHNLQGMNVYIAGGACTYEQPPLVLRSTVYRGSHNTGGSAVVAPGAPDQAEHGRQPREEIGPERIRTLEQLFGDFGIDRLDLLKIDAEGSEHSILRKCELSTLARIGVILGEWHGWAEWLETIGRFSPLVWDLDFLSEQGKRHGIFRLSQRAWVHSWQQRGMIYERSAATGDR